MATMSGVVSSQTNSFGKKEEKRDGKADERERIEKSIRDTEKTQLLKKAIDPTQAAEQGDATAQNQLGVSYASGTGVAKDSKKAIVWYTRAAKQGHIAAQYNLGVCYAIGEGVRKDPKKAAEWFTRAARQGDAAAQSMLGMCYDNGQGVEKDTKKAVEWYTKAAQQGHAAAQDALGICYANGEGVEQDSKKAAEWYTRAAEQGLADAQDALGICYANGEGVEQDTQKAIEWFTRAAKQGHPSAQNALGVCYVNGDGMARNPKRAAAWFASAAKQGHASAQHHLGLCYAKGDGVGKDPQKAVAWFTKAAEQGDAAAQSILGVYYVNGEGVGKDPQKAVAWFTRAAEQGHASAQHHLGLCYAIGNGVAKDPKAAVEWYTRAARQGVADAQYNLGILYVTGEGVEQDPKKAAEWYTKAAEQGIADAQHNLGICYANGTGVEEQDPKAAAEWFTRAARQGVAVAQYALGVCYANGEGVKKDPKAAAEWYTRAAEQAYAAAQHHLGVCYDNGEGVESDPKKAVEWYTRAAEQRVAIAQNNLGVCYYNGKGVTKDPKAAAEWFTRAAEQGVANAQYNLGVCYENGEGVEEKDPKAAAEWFTRAARQGVAAAQYAIGVYYYNGVGVAKDLKKAAEWFTSAAEQAHPAAQVHLGICYDNGESKERLELLTAASVLAGGGAAKAGNARTIDVLRHHEALQSYIELGIQAPHKGTEASGMPILPGYQELQSKSALATSRLSVHSEDTRSADHRDMEVAGASPVICSSAPPLSTASIAGKIVNQEATTPKLKWLKSKWEKVSDTTEKRLMEPVVLQSTPHTVNIALVGDDDDTIECARSRFTSSQKLYQTILRGRSKGPQPTFAYLYKLNDKNDKFEKKYASVWNKIREEFNEARARAVGDFSARDYFSTKLVEENPKHYHEIISYIVKHFKDINRYDELDKVSRTEDTKRVVEESHDDQESPTEQFFEDLRSKLIELLSARFFNCSHKTYRTLQALGVIYYPPDHTWMQNFSWVLGHLHKKHDFFILSSIIDSQFHTTEGYEDKPSAFALEICTVLKAGYDLIYHKKKRQFLLVPGQDFDLRSCASNGTPGHGIYPSKEEVAQIFSYLGENIEKLRQREVVKLSYGLMRSATSDAEIISSSTQHAPATTASYRGDPGNDIGSVSGSTVWEVHAKIAAGGGGMGFIGPNLTSSSLTARATYTQGTATSASVAGARGDAQATTSSRAHP